jgi:surfeit locus 1 family protein
MRRSIWPVLLFAALGVAVLVSLCIWQLQRLQWKEALIAAVDAAIAAEPVPLNQAIDKFLAGESIDFWKVRAKGRFAPREPLRLLTSANGAPAWTLVHGFEQTAGAPILVNRGKLPHGLPLPPMVGKEVEIVGLVHWHDSGRGFFDVDNHPGENLWYWWDVVAMSNQFSATHANPNYIVLDLVPGSPGTEGLVVDPPKAALRNNHLGYAITWFGLAVVLVVMAALFVLRQRQEAR